MATPQLSPGVLVREVDLTVGRAENVLDNIGAIAGPFKLGPVDEPITIENESQLISTFGKPSTNDNQYEYYMSGSTFLSYGGILKVIRTDDTDLKNANAGVSIASTTTLKIKSKEDYDSNYSTATNFTYAARNPGTWANTLKVCYIDDAADQRIGISTTNLATAGATIGYGVTTALSGIIIAGTGSTSSFNGYLKGIITGVSTDTGGNSTIDVKILSRVTSAGVSSSIDYQQSNPGSSISLSDGITFMNNSGVSTGTGSYTAATVVDWYDQQTLGLTNSTVYWKSLAQKPITSNFSSSRQGKNDGIHVVVVDDTGSVSGIQGSILEKHLNLSKASDATADGNSPIRSYYKDYINLYSDYIFAGYNASQAADDVHGT